MVEFELKTLVLILALIFAIISKVKNEEVWKHTKTYLFKFESNGRFLTWASISILLLVYSIYLNNCKPIILF